MGKSHTCYFFSFTNHLYIKLSRCMITRVLGTLKDKRQSYIKLKQQHFLLSVKKKSIKNG
jgi:hypothetical protein